MVEYILVYGTEISLSKVLETNYLRRRARDCKLGKTRTNEIWNKVDWEEHILDETEKKMLNYCGIR